MSSLYFYVPLLLFWCFINRRFIFFIIKAQSHWICSLFQQIHIIRIQTCIFHFQSSNNERILQQIYFQVCCKCQPFWTTFNQFFLPVIYVFIFFCRCVFVFTVHLQHAGKVPGQQPTGSQQPSSTIDNTGLVWSAALMAIRSLHHSVSQSSSLTEGFSHSSVCFPPHLT